MSARTLYRKLVESHTVATLDAQNVLMLCDLHLMNAYNSPQAFAGLHDRGRSVPVPGQNVAVVSQTSATVDYLNSVVERMRKAVTQYGV